MPDKIKKRWDKSEEFDGHVSIQVSVFRVHPQDLRLVLFVRALDLLLRGLVYSFVGVLASYSSSDHSDDLGVTGQVGPELGPEDDSRHLQLVQEQPELPEIVERVVELVLLQD